ncbi:MAG: complex I NDUFA9 subunit family protein [Dehalococcoidia bacterium]|jgi:NADH dehydrogenase
MILVTGGTGFIGRHLVAWLAASGQQVRVAARGERKADLPEGVEQVKADVVSGEGLAQAMAGVEAVVNLVGVIAEKGSQRFDAVIRGGTAGIVDEAERAGVKKLVYVSAIGAAPDPKFPYWHAKWQAEQSVTASRLTYTILRPSLVFGPEDDFFNRLARLIRRVPVVPVAGDGKTRFQPVWVEDVVSCVVASLGEGTHDRETLEIGGPEYFSYDEIIDLIGETLGHRKPKAHLPLCLMRPAARAMQSVLPNPPVTTDQLAMLSKDNTTELDAVPKAFGFQPRSLREGLAEQLRR